MAYAIADGAPCKEAAHEWTAFDGTEAPAMNSGWTHEEDVYLAIGEPSNFYGLPDSDNSTIPRQGQRGLLGLPSEELGATVVYNPVVVMARSLELLRSTAAEFRHAFQDRTNEGTMLLTPHATYSDIPWYFLARCTDLEPRGGDFQWNRGQRLFFAQQYVLSLLRLDPRFYVAGDPEEISGASAATVVATNDGRASTDPVFTITVPGGTPDIHLENLSLPTPAGHAELWLRDVPAGELVIDMRNRTMELDGLVADGFFDSAASDWLDELVDGLKPGANSIKVTGGAWSMSFRHASL